MTAPAMAAPEMTAPAMAAPDILKCVLGTAQVIARGLLGMVPGQTDPRYNDAAVCLRRVLKPHVDWLQTQDRELTPLDSDAIRCLRFIDEVVLDSTQ